MPTTSPTRLNTATKIRRQLAKGKSPSEIAKTTGASLGYVYAIKAKMTQPAPAPTPVAPNNPAEIRLEVPLIPFAPIPQQGIAGLKEEPQPQPVAAHAANEIVEEAVIEKADNHRYLWVLAGVLLLTALFLYYFGHRG